MNLTVVSVYPTLLGTYGDGGNVMALRHRARLHGIEVDVINIEPGDAVPESAELYVLGGGEDSAQTAAANALRADGSLEDDFALATRGRIVHVLNAPSPAATAALAIGEDVAQRLPR